MGVLPSLQILFILMIALVILMIALGGQPRFGPKITPDPKSGALLLPPQRHNGKISFPYFY
jgi:hypothetical protein